MARGGDIPPFPVPAAVPGLFDKRPWLAWARARGACLDLAGWVVPTPEIVPRIEADLGDVEHEVILLCRAETREVVLRLADRSLAVHQLKPGGHAPQRLAGWDAWPIDGAGGRRMASEDVFAALRKKFGGGDGA
jgi:hypothetical protein